MNRMRNVFIGVATALSLAMSASAGLGQTSTFSRDKAAQIVGDINKVVTPGGIDKLEEITIGGTKQWISIKGRDLHNPILLFIHGGPASPEMPTSWTFQSPWEDYFTVVQWDQRGAGRTYNANDPAKIGPTLHIPRMVEDAAEVVQYLRATFHVPKIFVMGHSWGSAVGLSLAQEHPDWLFAYIGMGQLINVREGEHEGYEWTLNTAQKLSNAQAIKELTAVAPYPGAVDASMISRVNTERKWNVMFGGLTYGRSSYDYYSHAAELSPDYSADDIAAIDKGSALSLPSLFSDLAAFDYSNITDFRCPIVMFLGRHDWTTPSDVVARWMTRVHAPVKKIVWFENSAHMIQIEEPGRVLVHLVEDVRPLAENR